MKQLVILVALVLMGISRVMAQGGYPVGCVPGVISITIGGQLLQSNNECVYTSRTSEQGYLPLLRWVSFTYNNHTLDGTVAGYQHIWRVDGSVTVEYLVVYEGSVGIDFMIKEVAVSPDLVNPI